jgi:hypothetical protein
VVVSLFFSGSRKEELGEGLLTVASWFCLYPKCGYFGLYFFYLLPFKRLFLHFCAQSSKVAFLVWNFESLLRPQGFFFFFQIIFY